MLREYMYVYLMYKYEHAAGALSQPHSSSMVGSPPGMAVFSLCHAKSVVTGIFSFSLCYVQIVVSVVNSFSLCYVQSSVCVV